MSDRALTTLLALIAVLIPALGGLFAFVNTMANKISMLQLQVSNLIPPSQITALAVKIDTLWMFHLRRGVALALDKDTVTMNSPIKIVDSKVREAYQPFMEQLAILAQSHKNKCDVDLAAAIEHKIGDELSLDICRKLQINNGECLVYAVILAKESIGQSFVLNDRRMVIR